MENHRLIISSGEDEASTRIGNFMIDHYPFRRQGNDPLYKHGEFFLLFTKKRHIYHENLEDDIRSLNLNPVDVIFLSRHSSSAGIRSLTVHATGNFGKADLGGMENALSMSDPRFMTSSLLELNRAHPEGFQVTFEATHHGPLLGIPNYFIEIGTTSNEWNDPDALKSVCEAVMNSSKRTFSNFVGIGGGHYSPKITSYALSEDVNIGHIISKHHHDTIAENMILQALERTPECSGFIMDKKGSRGRVRDLVKKISESRGFELIQI